MYTPAEIAALAEVAHEAGLLLHVDGARLVNAAEALGLELRETHHRLRRRRADPRRHQERAARRRRPSSSSAATSPRDYLYARKQGMQLASKMRFVSAQLLRLFEGDLWRETAGHANAMARRLGDAVAATPGVALAYPVQANAVFADPAGGGDRAPARAVPLLRLGRGGRRRALDVLVADDARGRRRARGGAARGAGRVTGPRPA